MLDMNNKLFSDKILTVFFAGVLCGLFVSFLLRYPLSHKLVEDQKLRIVEMYKNGEIGISAPEYAARIVSISKGERIFSRASGSVEIWSVMSQEELLQTNWILQTCFFEGKLVGKRIGTSDDLRHVPKGAPQPVYTNSFGNGVGQ